MHLELRSVVKKPHKKTPKMKGLNATSLVNGLLKLSLGSGHHLHLLGLLLEKCPLMRKVYGA